MEKPLFREIDADDPDQEATVIDSLCMHCHETVSVAKILKTIIYNFELSGCNKNFTYKNSVLQRSCYHVFFL